MSPVQPPPLSCPLSRPTRPLSVLFGHWRLSVGVYVQFTGAERSQFRVLLWNKSSSVSGAMVWVSRVSREWDHPLETTSSEEVNAAFVSLLLAVCLVIIPPLYEHRLDFSREIPTQLAHGRVHNTPSTKINFSQSHQDAWLGKTQDIHKDLSHVRWWAGLQSCFK